MRKQLLFAGLTVLAVLTHAMPPYPGTREPANLQALKLKGLDSPKDGLIFNTEVKDDNAKITGSRSYPVILGYFTDTLNTYTQAQFQAMLFSSAANAKSVNNYYRDMSYKAMSCSGRVAAWISSGNTVAYFGNGTNGMTYTDTIRSAYGFIKKTLAACDAAVDFSLPEYDKNGDGYVDVLWVVHAGRGGEEATTNDIWAHSWSLTSWMNGNGTAHTTNDPRPGYPGQYIKINKYIIQPEKTLYSGEGNTMIGCGVFCHEFGHALGLPDLYDTGKSVPGSGLGMFSVMAYGVWGGNSSSGARPVCLDTWSRSLMGWINPYNVIQNGKFTFNWTLADSHLSAVRMAKLGNPSTSQYWLVENRYKNAAGSFSGVKWDSLLLGSGLLIYHVDTTYSGSSTPYFINNTVNVNATGVTRNRPYGVAIEETDQSSAGYYSELWYGNNGGEAVDLWNSGTQVNFDSSGTAYPCSFFNSTTSTTASGGNSGIAVRGIPAAGKGGGYSKAMLCSLYVVPAGPLGVNLSQFTATSEQGGITLTWRTESEMESYTWELERSSGDAENYRTITNLPAYGTTNTAHDYSFTDNSPELTTGLYYYRLIQTDASNNKDYFGPVEVNYVKTSVVKLEYALLPSSPNPATNAVNINFFLKNPGNACLTIYNIAGQAVKTLVNGYRPAGTYSEFWDGRDDNGKKVSNGIYLYRLIAGNFQSTQKMTVLK